MALDVMALLEKFNRDYINRTVLAKHDEARALFRLPTIRVRDHREFNYLLTTYIQHHHQAIGDGVPPNAAAFGEGKRILEQAFNKDRHQDGYAVALQMALDGSQGGMRHILNEVTDAIKRRAYQDHIDNTFLNTVNVLSKKDNMDLAKAFFAHFRPTLERFGYTFDETSFVHDTRAAIEYYAEVLESIFRTAKKI